MLYIRLDKCIYFITTFVFWIACSFTTHALVVGTYNCPPFSMHEDNEQIGLATEAINDLLSKAGVADFKIENYPLARGIVELKSGRIDIFYPYVTDLNPTADQGKFILIGPISKYRLALFVRKDDQQEISLATIQNMLIGTERGGIGYSIFSKQNYKLEQATDNTSCLTMVLAKRITTCAVGTLPGMYLLALNNISDKIRFVETPLYADMYLALGPSLSAETIAAIQNAYAQMQQQHYFENKQIEYEKKFSIFIDSMS